MHRRIKTTNMTKLSTTTNKIKKKNPGHAKTLSRAAKKLSLTAKMASFCAEFMLDKNATAAAIRAGYNPRNAHGIGFNLLRHPCVKEEIARLVELVIEDHVVTHQMITNELFKIAFSDFNDFVEVVDVGTGEDKQQTVVFKPTSALKKGNGRIIKTLEIGRKGIKLQLNSKEQAIDMLARHVGYFGVDNSQKRPDGVLLYIPDNGRGDIKPADDDNKEQPTPGH